MIFLKTKSDLNDDEQRVFKRIPRYLNKLHTDLSKRDKYHENFLYGIDRLFNEDAYYEPVEVKALLMVTMYYMKVTVIKLDRYLY